MTLTNLSGRAAMLVLLAGSAVGLSGLTGGCCATNYQIDMKPIAEEINGGQNFPFYLVLSPSQQYSSILSDSKPLEWFPPRTGDDSEVKTLKEKNGKLNDTFQKYMIPGNIENKNIYIKGRRLGPKGFRFVVDSMKPPGAAVEGTEGTDDLALYVPHKLDAIYYIAHFKDGGEVKRIDWNAYFCPNLYWFSNPKQYLTVQIGQRGAITDILRRAEGE